MTTELFISDIHSSIFTRLHLICDTSQACKLAGFHLSTSLFYFLRIANYWEASAILNASDSCFLINSSGFIASSLPIFATSHIQSLLRICMSFPLLDRITFKDSQASKSKMLESDALLCLQSTVLMLSGRWGRSWALAYTKTTVKNEPTSVK